MRKTIWIAAIAFFLCSPVSADFYRYTDEKGRIRYTDDVRRIPAGQKADVFTSDGETKATIQPEETPEPKPEEPQPDSSMVTAPEASEKMMPAEWSPTEFIFTVSI